ncbi:SIS domain-containing protein [Burkholderia sp. BKH01]|uniref:SIS domain-containing protein n=1 Tax=Burkholderia sp. BKH01 TaxID=2769262 RepID=UPI0021E0D445|nr:SIS domain-containing protein [Burkholderia sp. BKH01]MCU9951932.1 SIS domain-containing protein [Burkholderia sp. BKH01]
MNVTERVIQEQFQFWPAALATPSLEPTDCKFVIVGCGTSYHLAQCIAASLSLRGSSAIAVPGGEWARRRRAYVASDANVHVIALSRSGESTETVQALEVSRAAGLKTTAITCEADSSITRHADSVVFAETHPSEGIVMTSSASLMLIMGLRLAGVTLEGSVVNDAMATMGKLDRALPDALAERSHFVYLGAGPMYGIAGEGSIKVQEMSLSYANTYHTMEYRHGPVSLVDDKTLAVLLYSPDTRDEEAKLAAELIEKGAMVLGFGGPGSVEIELPGVAESRAIMVLPALQILGERVAELRGLDTTAPRHLNKVVTL